MKIELRLYATLRKYAPEGSGGIMNVQTNEGSTVADLLNELKIDLSEVIIILVNGVSVDKTHVLCGGDRLGVFPPVGGG